MAKVLGSLAGVHPYKVALSGRQMASRITGVTTPRWPSPPGRHNDEIERIGDLVKALSQFRFDFERQVCCIDEINTPDVYAGLVVDQLCISERLDLRRTDDRFAGNATRRQGTCELESEPIVADDAKDGYRPDSQGGQIVSDCPGRARRGLCSDDRDSRKIRLP